MNIREKIKYNEALVEEYGIDEKSIFIIIREYENFKNTGSYRFTHVVLRKLANEYLTKHIERRLHITNIMEDMYYACTKLVAYNSIALLRGEA